MIHTILLTRESEPDVNAILTLSSDVKCSEEVFLKFHRVLYCWLTTTEAGKHLCAASSGDFNIGDFASYDVTIPTDPVFQELMAESGLSVVSLASADYRTTYDRILCSDPDPDPVILPPRPKFEVVVGNIGSVYHGDLLREALLTFKVYKDQSKEGYGRAGGEQVTLFRDGEPWREYAGIFAHRND